VIEGWGEIVDMRECQKFGIAVVEKLREPTRAEQRGC
jgi:hypothetical protein